MQLSDAAVHMHGIFQGQSARFDAVSTDSRSVTHGDLFFALSGPSFDGHDYLEQVKERGACAAVVTESYLARHGKVSGFTTIAVKDVVLALGQLAQAWRQQFNLKVIAITGSSGKTTVKEMTAAILSQAGPTLATDGNFNNHIGVPLTLCRLAQHHQFAVIELGASGLGEISYSAGLTRADVALVNNVAGAHLEGFGSIDNIATAKGEIYESLQGGGTAVMNQQDHYFNCWDEALSKRNEEQAVSGKGGVAQLTFSSLPDSDADIFLINSQQTPEGFWQCKVGIQNSQLDVTIPLLGKHNVDNMLAAIACVLPLGIDMSTIAVGLSKMKPVKGRMDSHLFGDILVVDDSYNANESSVMAAINYLADLNNYRTVLVLGDLAELGDQSESVHFNIGAYAREKSVDCLIGVGKSVSKSVAAYGEQGFLFESHQEAVTQCLEFQYGKTCILVKGSRSSAMEIVVNELVSSLSVASPNSVDSSNQTAAHCVPDPLNHEERNKC